IRGVSSTAKLPVSKTGLGGSNPSAPARFLESQPKQGRTRKEPMAKAVTMAREDQGNKVTQFPARIKGFLTDVRNEMRKVTFPNRKEVQATTTVVIITVILFGIYFFVIDQVIASGINWVLHHRIR